MQLCHWSSHHIPCQSTISSTFIHLTEGWPDHNGDQSKPFGWKSRVAVWAYHGEIYRDRYSEVPRRSTGCRQSFPPCPCLLAHCQRYFSSHGNELVPSLGGWAVDSMLRPWILMYEEFTAADMVHRCQRECLSSFQLFYQQPHHGYNNHISHPPSVLMDADTHR